MLLRRLTFFAAVLGLVVGLAVARPAEAGLVVTITATGTITEGDDGNGGNLAGLGVTMTQVFAQGGPAFVSPGFSFAAFNQVALALSVDGLPPVFLDSALTAGGAAVYTIATLANGTAGVGSFASIFLTPFGELQTFMDVSNAAAEIAPSTALLQNFVFPPVPNGTTMYFGATLLNDVGDVESYFLAERVTQITIEVTQVPAPAAFGLFVVAVAGLVAARRRVGTTITH
jgi:hypothetical protein